MALGSDNTNNRKAKVAGNVKAAVPLSDAKILALKPPKSGQLEYLDATVPGLRLRIGVTGTKTFVLRKRIAGKNRNLTLGRFGERLTVAEARKKARQILSDVELKADPAAALPKPQRRVVHEYTLNALWPAYRQSKAHLRTIGEVERIFKQHLLPEFGDRAADGITRSEITRFIDRIGKRTPVMARNVLSQFSAFYSWALPRLDRLPGNPCRDAGRPPKPKSRERVLAETEIGALWHVLEGEGHPFGPAIKLLLLTGQRRNEVFEAERLEFDLDKKVWTIPAARAKNGVAHLVPLSTPVLALVKGLLRNDRGDKLIPARGNWEAGPSGFSKAMNRLRSDLQARIGSPVPHWTLHDLRRTTATGLQRLGIRLEVTEAVLNHLSGARSGIVGVYQRHHYFDEKRSALVDWAKEVHCLARASSNANSAVKRKRRTTANMREAGQA